MEGEKKLDFLRQLMSNMTDNIFFKDLDSRFIMMNQAHAQWLRIADPEEAVGKCDFDFYTEEFASSTLADEQEIFKTGAPLTCKEEHASWDDGFDKWVFTTKVPLKDEEGNIVGLIGIGRDITKLKSNEKELIETAERLQATNVTLLQASKQIHDDLRMAANLQKAFLPQEYPVFENSDGHASIEFYHHYEASQFVGGDFCSIHKITESKVGMFICDVMGHGVRSALVTGIISAIENRLAGVVEDPGEFLTAMNRELFPLLRGQQTFLFATACYVVVDFETGFIQYASAGHPAPCLIEFSQKVVSALSIPNDNIGAALALVADHRYHTFDHQISQDSTLLLYTDGLTETVNSQKEQYGEERLRLYLKEHLDFPLNTRINMLVEDARSFSDGGAFDDDVCIVACHLTGKTKGYDHVTSGLRV